MMVVVVVVIIVPRCDSRVGIESKGMRVGMEGAGGNRRDGGEDTRGGTRGRSDGEGRNVEGELVLVRLVVLGIGMLVGWLNPILLLLLLALGEVGERVHIQQK
jgi:hypothetical protein